MRKRKKCLFKGCKVAPSRKLRNKYCCKHRKLKKERIYSLQPRNSRVYQKNRKLVIERNNGKCLYCENIAKQAHHKDLNPFNHNIENLEPVCLYCHFKIHTGRKNKKSKYMDIYGYNMKEIMEILKYHNITGQSFYFYHEKGIVKALLNSIKKPIIKDLMVMS